MWLTTLLFVSSLFVASRADPAPAPSLHSFSARDELFEQPARLMAPRAAHLKADPMEGDAWAPLDFGQLDPYLASGGEGQDPAAHNRIKRKAKRRRGRLGRRKNRTKGAAPSAENEIQSNKTSSPPLPGGATRRKKERKDKDKYDLYETSHKDSAAAAGFVEMPKDLYQAHLRPGVIFRIHMSEAVLKMQYRNYGEDKDESVIEADVEYLRLTRKVISDELTKFEDLRWLTEWFGNRTDLIQEHVCNTRYYAVGIPPTAFTHKEEYMKRACLFDSVYIDHIPYAVGEDGSLLAAVAPPVLHCDAATCTSVPFIDSVMFDERLARTNVRTVTRCQASCRAHCRNDPDCLKRCSDRCLHAD